jgi:hypothetical protein
MKLIEIIIDESDHGWEWSVEIGFGVRSWAAESEAKAWEAAVAAAGELCLEEPR